MQITLDSADLQAIENYKLKLDSRGLDFVSRNAETRTVKFHIVDHAKANNFMGWLMYMSGSKNREELCSNIGCYVEEIGLVDSFSPANKDEVKKKLHEYIDEIIQ